MRRFLVSLMIGIVLCALLPLHGEGPATDSEKTSPIAESGGAEIGEIQVVRWKASDAVTEADLTNITVGFWFPVKWQRQSNNYLVRLVRLGPVVDNTGKVLSTKKRRADIYALQGEVMANIVHAGRGKQGPFLKVVLEVPARRATALKALQGQAEVSQVRLQTLKFDLVASVGKPLRHPLLKDFPIKPEVESRKGGTNVTLRVPAMHDRLVFWELEADGRVLVARVSGRGITELKDRYSGALPQGCLLVLKFAAPVETKTFTFNFQNIELP